MAVNVFKMVAEIALTGKTQIRRDLDEIDKKAQDSALSFGRNWSNASMTVAKGIAAVGAAAGAALTLVGIKGVQVSREFSAGMARIQTLLGEGATPRVRELSGGVEELALEVGRSTQDMQDGLFQTISALGDSSEAMGIFEQAAKAAAGGNTATLDAVNLVAAALKGYGEVSEEAATKVLDLAFKTNELGQTTFAELAQNMQTVIPIAESMGVSIETLFGVMATLTGVTGNTSIVATQLRSILNDLSDPSKELAAALERMGFATGSAAIEAIGLDATLKGLKEAVDGDTDAFRNLFGRVEGTTAALALTGAQADNFTRKTKAMEEAGGAAASAFRIMQDESATLGERGGVAFDLIAKAAGDQLLPIIDRLADLFIKNFPRIKEITTNTFAGIAGAMGFFLEKAAPVGRWLTEHAEIVIPAFAGAITVSLIPALGALATSFGLTAAAAAPIVGVFVSVGAAIAAAIALYRNFQLRTREDTPEIVAQQERLTQAQSDLNRELVFSKGFHNSAVKAAQDRVDQERGILKDLVAEHDRAKTEQLDVEKVTAAATGDLIDELTEKIKASQAAMTAAVSAGGQERQQLSKEEIEQQLKDQVEMQRQLNRLRQIELNQRQTTVVAARRRVSAFLQSDERKAFENVVALVDEYNKLLQAGEEGATTEQLEAFQERVQAQLRYYSDRGQTDTAYFRSLEQLEEELTEHLGEQNATRVLSWENYRGAVLGIVGALSGDLRTISVQISDDLELAFDVQGLSSGSVVNTFQSLLTTASAIPGPVGMAATALNGFTSIMRAFWDSGPSAEERRRFSDFIDSFARALETNTERFGNLMELGFTGTFETIQQAWDINLEEIENADFEHPFLQGSVTEAATQETVEWIARIEELYNAFVGRISDNLREAFNLASLGEPFLAWQQFVFDLGQSLFNELVSRISEAFSKSALIGQAVAPFIQATDAFAQSLVGARTQQDIATAAGTAIGQFLPALSQLQERLPAIQTGFNVISGVMEAVRGTIEGEVFDEQQLANLIGVTLAQGGVSQAGLRPGGPGTLEGGRRPGGNGTGAIPIEGNPNNPGGDGSVPPPWNQFNFNTENNGQLAQIVERILMQQGQSFASP